MESHPDWWLISFLSSSALLVCLEMWRGWRAGVVRQLINLTALFIAYPAAIWMGRIALRNTLRFDLLVAAIISFIVGMTVFLVLSIGIRHGLNLLWPQDSKTTGLKQNASGSVIGGLFGVLLVWLMIIGIRLLGTVAENFATLAQSHPHPQPADAVKTPTPVEPAQEPNGLITGLSALKESLDRGTMGKMMNRVDPVPTRTYTVLAKITRIIVDPGLVERFMTYPGAKTLAEHPKIIALRDDPEIQRVVLSKNILPLLTNERVTAVVNDPDLGDLVRKFELEKALDFALQEERPVN